MIRRVGWLCLCVLLVPSFGALAQEAPSPVREITPLSGDLYQAKDADRVTVFLVTADGIALADPLNVEFARWLKGELEIRFPGRVVRYVLHTSHAYERAAGAWVFNDTAEIVAQDAFQDSRLAASTSLPASWAPFDRNHNSVLERSEAIALGPAALTRDRNRDTEITAAEAWGDVTPPETTFRTRHVMEIGRQHIELVHPGDGLGRDVSAILFREQRFLFAPAVPLHAAPESFAPASPAAFADSLRQLERLQFDAMLSGSGETATLADMALVREYVEELVAAVKAAFRQGNRVEQVQASLDLGQFSQLRFIDARRGRNIAEAFQMLRPITVDAFGAAQFVLQSRGTPPCTLSAIPTIKVACEGIGGRTFAGMGGGAVMVGRLGGAVEISRAGELTGHEQSFGSAIVTSTHRETATSFMFRYQPTAVGRIQAVATAGIARLSAAQQTDLLYLRGYKIQSVAMAIVVGGDLALAAGPVRLLVPIRLTRDPAHLFLNVGPGARWTLRFGVGVSVPVARVVI